MAILNGNRVPTTKLSSDTSMYAAIKQEEEIMMIRMGVPSGLSKLTSGVVFAGARQSIRHFPYFNNQSAYFCHLQSL